MLNICNNLIRLNNILNFKRKQITIKNSELITCVYIHTCILARMHACTHAHARMFTCTHRFRDAHTCMHTCTHTHAP